MTPAQDTELADLMMQLVPPTPLPTSPIRLIKNSGFTGGALDWSKTDGCLRTTSNSNNGQLSIGGGWFGAGQAYLGTRTCTFYQEVKLPAHSYNTVEFWAGAAFSGPGWVRLSVTDANGIELVALYSRTSTEGFEQIDARTSVDLTRYAGKTVRIQGQSFTDDGTLNTLGVVGVDVLTYPRSDAIVPAPVPTLSEWAMILLGVLLAGGAALTIQRRRASV